MASLFGTHTSMGVPVQDDPFADFRNFLYVVWKHLNLPDPTPVQYDIANYLQQMAYSGYSAREMLDFLQNDEELTRIIIEAFRGVGKSWITSAFVCWLLYMNPQLNILVVSASKQRADDFTTFTLRLIKEMDILEHLIPGPEQRQSKVSFDVGPARASHAPSVKSAGISGQLAGSRADVIVPDDIEIPNNSATQGMRDKLSEAVKEFDAILKPGGRIAYLGTPQTEMSLYNVLPNRGYKVRIWPARYPDKERQMGYGAALAPRIANRLVVEPALVGKTTDPQRFSDMDLLERELSYGRSGFALQFMLDTRLSDAERYPLKLADLMVMDVHATKAPEGLIYAANPELRRDELPAVGFSGDFYYRPWTLEGDWLEYTGAVMSIDPAGRGTDETGYAVAKMLNSNIFVPAAGGISGGYSDEAMMKLAKIAKEQQVKLIIIEANFGDGMFTQLFTPFLKKVGYPCTVEEVKHHTQKERRIIDTLEPVMNQHRLIFDKSVIQKDYESTQNLPPEQALSYQLFYQLTRITRDRGAIVHDDRLDALAIAVGYWVEQMALDQKERQDTRRDEQLRREIQATIDAAALGFAVMMGSTAGLGETSDSWIKRRQM